MTREQWRVYWRWLRLEKKRLAWEHEPPRPEAPILIDWGEVGRHWGKPIAGGPPIVLGRFSTEGDPEP